MTLLDVLLGLVKFLGGSREKFAEFLTLSRVCERRLTICELLARLGPACLPSLCLGLCLAFEFVLL